MINSFLGEGSTAGLIFGATGGVMEAALRTAVEKLSGEELKSLDFTEVRGTEGIKEASYTVNGMEIKVCVVSGLANANTIMEKVKNGTADYHFIEIMGCPGGCIGGAGTIADPVRTAAVLNKYVKDATFTDPEQSAFMSNIHMLKDDPNFEV